MSSAVVDTFYVKAVMPKTAQEVAGCRYFTDAACTVEVFSPLSSSSTSGNCTFVQAPSSVLPLVGAVFKTLGGVSTLAAQNFAPATPQALNPSINQLGFPMPVVSVPGQFTTKGVVLIFANPGQLADLYPSADPQVQNNGG